MTRKALTAAILVAISPAPVLAQTLPDAEAFVRRLYAAYDKGEPGYMGKRARKAFSPAMVKLIRKEEADAKAAGEVGRLDWDPLCGCQDNAGLTLKSVEVRSMGPGQARVVADIGARKVTLLLVSAKPRWSKARWRIDDLWTPDTPELKKLLSTPAR